MNSTGVSGMIIGGAQTGTEDPMVINKLLVFS